MHVVNVDDLRYSDVLASTTIIPRGSSITKNLLDTLKSEDASTLYHSINVAIIAKYIARILKLDDATINEITTAALLHDIGKLQVPNEILYKRDKLTHEEFDIIKEHPTLGYHILKQAGCVNTDIIHGVFEHHERWDGYGYPMGLCDLDIHIYARIIAIADVYDALVSERSYKKALSREDAIECMKADSGHFDTDILNRFLHSIENTSSNGVDILRIS